MNGDNTCFLFSRFFAILTKLNANDTCFEFLSHVNLILGLSQTTKNGEVKALSVACLDFTVLRHIKNSFLQEISMPRNQFQRMVFAFITVVITVHAYVFYSIYVVNGDSLRQAVGTTSVLSAVRTIGGIYMFGRVMPVWSVVLVEFCFAYFMECVYGSPLSFRLACKNFDPKTTHPVLFETAIICATVGLMVPAMSLIATFLYYPYNNGFQIYVALVQWLRLMCFNFPFAFFTQLFFIQPFVRTVFKLIFAGDIKK